MGKPEFPGRDKMVALLDAAVGKGDEKAVTDAVSAALCELFHDSGVELPACVLRPVAGHYARRDIHLSPQYGYSVIAMTWGPGQGTQVHDHGGLWCVEGVWQGELEITNYLLMEQQQERFRFQQADAILAGPGSTGSLIPPHEYHTIRNPSADVVGVSLHVYQRHMPHCYVFPLAEDGSEWRLRERRQLDLDDA